MVSVGVSRKVGTRNQTRFLPIGEMFDFTDEEIKQIREVHPEGGLRRPINETTGGAERTQQRPAEVTSEEDHSGEENAEVTEEETSTVQSAGRMTPQQQRQRDAQTQRDAQAARRASGRRTAEDEDL
jgi:hypothetical protein